MTRITLSILMISLFLTACGQIGPLYLPNQKPPVYVPKPKKETKTETNSTVSANHS